MPVQFGCGHSHSLLDQIDPLMHDQEFKVALNARCGRVTPTVALLDRRIKAGMTRCYRLGDEKVCSAYSDVVLHRQDLQPCRVCVSAKL